ncbi:MAG: glycosyl transferase, partial [Thermodesulfobacteriota bacterium]
SLMLFFSSQLFFSNSLGIFGLILAGAVLGFLPFNFNPAKIFMGDSGSMFLGYSLAIISIVETNRHIANLATIMFIPVMILSVPIFDTIFVTIARLTRGKKVFEGGKDHTSHRLVSLGLSQRKTVLLLYFISIVFGLIALLSPRLNMLIVLTIAVLGAVILLLFAFFLSDSTLQKKKFDNKDRAKPENNTVLNSIFMHKRRIAEVILDFILICVAYSLAYFLRFENQLLSSNLNLLKESLVWIILIKMSVFFISGLYHGVWKYISISDLFTMLKVVTLGSIISVLFLTFIFRFKEYSRAVFFIDWLILLFLVTGSRLSFRILGEFFGRLSQKGADNILIFGAGDAGEAVIREIKRNKSLNYNPIGFIDDDP